MPENESQDDAEQDNAIVPNNTKATARAVPDLPTWLNDVPTAHRTASASMPGARRCCCCPVAAPAAALAPPSAVSASAAARAAAAASTLSLSPSKTSAMPARMRMRSSTVTTSDTDTAPIDKLPPPPPFDEALATAKDGWAPLLPSAFDPRSNLDGSRHSWYTRGGRQSSCCCC